jgi:hypothetical protein
MSDDNPNVIVRNADGTARPISLEPTQQDVLANLQAINSLVPTVFDNIALSYTGGDLTQVVYKLGATVVSTLTLTYAGGNLTSVVKT